MKRSSITWTDFSGGDLNAVTGCTPVSEGCQHCYARRIYERFGKEHSKVMLSWEKLERLAKAQFPQDGNRRGPHTKPMAFVCDTGDLFHESVGVHYIWKAMDMMASRQDVTWQVLTKRARRMQEFMTAWTDGKRIPSNIWLGVTCENQRRADERIPLLLQTPAAVRFVSVEPMLGPVDLARSIRIASETTDVLPGITLDWVICGGESGPNARPMDLDWARSLRDQCKAARVPFFYKQSGGLRPGTGEMLGGQMYREWPEGV